MKRVLFMMIGFIILSTSTLQAENFYFFGNSSFINAQFWERHISSDNSVNNRKVITNFTGATIGVGMEWVIWDIGIKRGSRIFLDTRINFALLGFNYMGQTDDTISYSPIHEMDIGKGAMYSGLSLDLYLGGTFPKMNLKWGFGSDFFFMFPTYSSISPRNSEKYAFFATPSIFIAYDFFIPDAKIKISPMIKTGITTVPLIPDDFLTNQSKYTYAPENWYSGLYISASISVSFKTVEWKK